MLQSLGRALQGEKGVTIKFIAALLIMVSGIFVFLSSTSCGETNNNGCGNGNNNPPVNTAGSAEVSVEDVNKPAFDAVMAGPIGPFKPMAAVQRTLSYSGSGVTHMTWSPPPGASSYNFPGAVSRQSGGPPFVFLNPPNSFIVSYNLPGLPIDVDNEKLSESLKCEGQNFSSSFASLVDTVQRSVTSAAAPTPAYTASQAQAADQTISVYSVDQWRSAPGEVITTTGCQNLYDWLQGEDAFAAVRVPVTVTAGGSSFPLPLIIGPDETKRPMITFRADGAPVTGIPDLPLEMRPTRLTYLENNLPAASGEAWMAIGVSASQKVTCPPSLDVAGWEFHFNLPLDLVGKATDLPFYYCYEGNDAPPVGVAAARIMAGVTSPGAQSGGITCLGPQDQSLDPNPSIQIGNPGVAWNIIPPKQVSFMHELIESSGTATAVNLTVSSTLTDITWKLYKGDYSAPDLTRPIQNPWMPVTTFDSFWVVGTVPTDTVPGSYNVTVTVAEASHPAITAHMNDILWVGEWTPPTGSNYIIYLPAIRK